MLSRYRAEGNKQGMKIRDFLDGCLNLALSKSEIFPNTNGLDFVGYRHFPDFVLLRKRTLKKTRARMAKIGTMPEISPANVEKFRGQVASAHGWLKYACSYNLRKKMQFNRLRAKVEIRA